MSRLFVIPQLQLSHAPSSPTLFKVTLLMKYHSSTSDGIDNPVAPIDVQVRVEALHPRIDILVKFRRDA
jgi:hypothetical protein